MNCLFLGFMIVGLKESIPYDPVISRKNNYRNYLNERQGTHLTFYLSEAALIREGARGCHLSQSTH